MIRIGTSGWVYPHWRGPFYPRGLAHRLELAYLAARLDSVEINASFYRLQRPATYQRWFAETPDGFLFAVKGSRYLTHMGQLRNAEQGLANFLASGVLALGAKLGPMLWQLPSTMEFDAGTLEAFLALLPRTTGEAAALARKHDTRLDGRAWTTTDDDRPIEHVLEPRHASFGTDAATDLLRRHGVGLVQSYGAARWPMFEAVTARTVYVRLHGHEQLYASNYPPAALRRWAARVRAWDAAGLGVYVYFDNDGSAYAPHNAMQLRECCEPAEAAE